MAMIMDEKTMNEKIASLGIMDIQASSGILTKELVSDAIRAVESVPLDIKQLAAEARRDIEKFHRT